MHNFGFLLLIPILIFGILPSYAETYNLEIDEHQFAIEYDVDADVLAMAIDQELNSFLIGIENTRDSIFTITLDNEMLSAENNEFAILVDGLEVNYDVTSNAESVEIMFFVPTGTQEIEIIGTHVIPEFPLALLVLIVSITGIILFTKKPRYILR